MPFIDPDYNNPVRKKEPESLFDKLMGTAGRMLKAAQGGARTNEDFAHALGWSINEAPAPVSRGNDLFTQMGNMPDMLTQTINDRAQKRRQMLGETSVDPVQSVYDEKGQRRVNSNAKPSPSQGEIADLTRNVPLEEEAARIRNMTPREKANYDFIQNRIEANKRAQERYPELWDDSNDVSIGTNYYVSNNLAKQLPDADEATYRRIGMLVREESQKRAQMALSISSKFTPLKKDSDDRELLELPVSQGTKFYNALTGNDHIAERAQEFDDDPIAYIARDPRYISVPRGGYAADQYWLYRRLTQEQREEIDQQRGIDPDKDGPQAYRDKSYAYLNANGEDRKGAVEGLVTGAVEGGLGKIGAPGIVKGIAAGIADVGSRAVDIPVSAVTDALNSGDNPQQVADLTKSGIYKAPGSSRFNPLGNTDVAEDLGVAMQAPALAAPVLGEAGAPAKAIVGNIFKNIGINVSADIPSVIAQWGIGDPQGFKRALETGELDAPTLQTLAMVLGQDVVAGLLPGLFQSGALRKLGVGAAKATKPLGDLATEHPDLAAGLATAGVAAGQASLRDDDGAFSDPKTAALYGLGLGFGARRIGDALVAGREGGVRAGANRLLGNVGNEADPLGVRKIRGLIGGGTIQGPGVNPEKFDDEPLAHAAERAAAEGPIDTIRPLTDSELDAALREYNAMMGAEDIPAPHELAAEHKALNEQEQWDNAEYYRRTGKHLDEPLGPAEGPPGTPVGRTAAMGFEGDNVSPATLRERAQGPELNVRPGQQALGEEPKPINIQGPPKKSGKYAGPSGTKLNETAEMPLDAAKKAEAQAGDEAAVPERPEFEPVKGFKYRPSQPGEFSVGQRVYVNDPKNGFPEAGWVTQITRGKSKKNGKPGPLRVWVQTKEGLKAKRKPVPKLSNGLLTQVRRNEYLRHSRTQKAIERGLPTPAMQVDARVRMQAAIESGGEQLNAKRRIADRLGSTPGDETRIPLAGALDPNAGRGEADMGFRKANNSSGNSERGEQAILEMHAELEKAALAPLLGDGTKIEAFNNIVGAIPVLRKWKDLPNITDATLRRAGAQAAPLAASVGLAGSGVMPGDEAGFQKSDEGLIALGLLGTGALSHAQSKGLMHGRNWEKFTLTPAAKKGLVKSLPDRFLRGDGKLIHIIETSGLDESGKWYSAYNIAEGSPEMQAIVAFQELRKQRLQETNAFLQQAGLPLIPSKLTNSIYMWFTEESIKKAGLYKEIKGNAELAQKPPEYLRGIGITKQSLQKGRQLADNYVDALTQFPDLEIAGSFEELMRVEAKQHAKIRANAVFAKSLQDQGMAEVFPRDYELLPTPQRNAWRARDKALRDKGWRSVPGFENHLFSPEVVAQVDSMVKKAAPGAQDSTGETVLNFFDNVTNFVRQAMFVGDLTWWTMQGTMAALENPVATLRNAHHLIGASVFGNNYVRWWLSQPENMKLYQEFVRAGGMPGREFEGFERSAMNIAGLPGFKQLEEAGVNAFLPIHRVLMWDHIRKGEMLADMLGGKAAKMPLLSDIVRDIPELARYAPAIAGITATATDNEIDIPGLSEAWDQVFTVALGMGMTFAADRGIHALGNKALTRARGKFDVDINSDGTGMKYKFDDATRAKAKATMMRADITAGKEINRISGIMNRQQMGISPEQSRIERVFLFRSPALTRNSLIMVKHALTDSGPEGALARAYLVKTAALMGTAMAAFKLASTGEWDSFDPSDPDSVFSADNFLTAEMPGNTLSAPNPNIALVRALLRQQHAAGYKDGWNFNDVDPATTIRSLSDWAGGRTPDNPLGAGVKGLLEDNFGTNYQFEKSTIPDLIAKGDVKGLVGKLGKPLIPVSWQALGESGFLPDSPLTPDKNPNIRPGMFGIKQAIISVFGNLAGYNAKVETLSQARSRMEQDMRKQLGMPKEGGTPGQNKELKAAKEADPVYQSVSKAADTLQALRNEGKMPDTVSLYLEGQHSISDQFTADLAVIDARYRAGEPIKDLKAAYTNALTSRRAKQQQNDKLLGALPSGVRGYEKMSVAEYLRRNDSLEQQDIDIWHDIFTQATVHGELDFERLDTLQQAFLNSLPEDRAIALAATNARETGSRDNMFTQDLQRAKEIARPYWDMQNSIFQSVKQRYPELREFQNRAAFDKYIGAYAQKHGFIDANEALDSLSKVSLGFKVYQDSVARAQEMARISDRNLDQVLVDWYQRAPQNPENKEVQKLTRLAALNPDYESRQDDLRLKGFGYEPPAIPVDRAVPWSGYNTAKPRKSYSEVFTPSLYTPSNPAQFDYLSNEGEGLLERMLRTGTVMRARKK